MSPKRDIDALLGAASPEVRRLNPGVFAQEGHQEAPPLQKDGAGGGKVRGKAAGRVEVAIPRARGPKMTKTEERYYDYFLHPHLGPRDFILVALPQGLRVWLANGSRYTADWFLVTQSSDGRLSLSAVEVKGARRHPSHYRSLMAVRQAALEFPAITWQIATWDGSTWRVEICWDGLSPAKTATPDEQE
jgi:hypothetical protein